MEIIGTQLPEFSRSSPRRDDIQMHMDISWRFKGKSVHAFSMQCIAAVLNLARPQAPLAFCARSLVPILRPVHVDGFEPMISLGKSSLT